MNFNKNFNFNFNYNLTNLLNLSDFSDFSDLYKQTNSAEFQTYNYLLNSFDSYESFCKFMNVIKSIPTIEQIDNLTKSNDNLKMFEIMESYGYFKLLNPIQKYHLFVSACSYDSIDIAMLIFNNDIDLEGVKEFMIKYLVQVGTNTEYMIFRKIWEKKIINFNLEEINEIFFSILKSSNLEFVEWFCSLNLININDDEIKKKIASDILANACDYQDFIVSKFICSLYINKSKSN